MDSNTHAPLRVYFNAFWPGFMSQQKTLEFFTRLLGLVFGTDIKITSDVKRAELLVESGFGPSILGVKPWRATFLFMGESWTRPNWRDYTVVLSGQARTDGPNVVPLPLYALYLYDTAPDGKVPEQIARPMPTSDVIAIVSNPVAGVRTAFLDELDKHFKVVYAGKYKNNVGGPLRPAYGSPAFFHFISKFKYVITMENSAQDSYITEKIFHGFFAHNVPVYWGAPRVEEYINPARFLHVHNDSPDEFARVIAEMKRLAADPPAWQSVIAQQWEAPGVPQPSLESIASQIRTMIQ
jgi:hypothetical protein